MAQSWRSPQICEADAEAALEAPTRKNGDVPSIRLMIDIHRYPDLQKSAQSKMKRCLWKLMKTPGLELREGSHGAVSAVARWRSEILWHSSCLVGTVPVVLVCFRILTICQVISSITSVGRSLNWCLQQAKFAVWPHSHPAALLSAAWKLGSDTGKWKTGKCKVPKNWQMGVGQNPGT